MEKRGVCESCGKLVPMYCYRCGVWRCCKVCEKPATTKPDELLMPENPVPTIKELCLNSGTNSTESKEIILDSEELIYFQYTPVVIVETLGHFKYTVVMKSNYLALCKLSADLQLTNSSQVGICEGNLCAAMYQSQWYRGQILSVKPCIKVKYIDFGNEEIVTRADLKRLPDDAMNLKAQAIRIELLSGTPEKYSALPLESELTVACVERIGEVSVVMVEDVVYEVDVQEETVISQNSPTKEGKSLINNCEKYIFLDEGEIILTHSVSLNEIYVVPVNAETSKFQEQINSALKHCGNTSVTNVPVTGTVVAAKYIIDQEYYRAVVTAVHNRKNILVKFIDFGNEEEVSLKDLLEISNDVLCVPRLAVPVKVRNISDVQCKEAKAFIQSLIVRQERLTMKLSSDKSYVDLYLPNGELFSNKINMILERFGLDCSKFLISDVPTPSYQGGTLVQLYVHSVLYSLDELCASSIESLFSLKLFKKQFQEYCENSKPYTPSKNEVCFGQLEDAWHRCCVLNIKNNETEVKMIDTGESAIIYNFRQMNKQFMDIEAGGLRCKLKDVSDSSKPEVKELLQMFLRPKSTIQVTIVEQSGCYCLIEIQFLKKLLKKVVV